MGLGKTVQVLSYLLAMKQNGQTLPSLIVCPASLVLNWAEECQKFTPELSCVVVDGDAAHRAELAESWPAADLVVTSYDLLRRDEALYEGQEFYACILDEAQAIKNHTTQKYKAVCKVRSRVRFALTGTPVENRLGELWSIFSFLMPGYLPPYKSFCSRFEKPIVQEEDQTAVRRLNQLTGPFILRRMKSDVLKELPPKTENVYRIELEEEQRKLYLAAVVDARGKAAGRKARGQDGGVRRPHAAAGDLLRPAPYRRQLGGRQRQAGRLRGAGLQRRGGRPPHPAVQPVHLDARAAGKASGRRGHQPFYAAGLDAKPSGRSWFGGSTGGEVSVFPHLAAGRRHRP